MRKTLIVGILVCLAGSVLGQTIPSTPQQGSQVISSGTTNNQNTVLTNQSGQTFTVQQLANQLQNLRVAVDQTLPMLSEFNQRLGASSQSLGGAISGLLSGALHKNGNQSPSTTSTSGQEITNLLAALGSLVNTNSQAPAVPQDTARNLATLQKDLQPVAEVMRTMNFGTTNQSTIPQANAPGTLTPTGR